MDFSTLSPFFPKEVSTAVPSFSMAHFTGLGRALCSGLWPGTRLHPGLHSRHSRRCLPGLHHVWNDRAWSCTHLQRSLTPQSRPFLSGKMSAAWQIVFAYLYKTLTHASPKTGPTGLHIYSLYAHPVLPEEEWTSEEEHGFNASGSRRKTRYPVPSEWKATFKWKESSKTYG